VSRLPDLIGKFHERVDKINGTTNTNESGFSSREENPLVALKALKILVRVVLLNPASPRNRRLSLCAMAALGLC
jgi:hypothetical protein